MSRWIIVFIQTLILVFGVSGLALAQEGGLETSVKQELKLRAGPGTQWAVLGYVKAGEVVRLDGRAAFENLWVRGITTDGRIGWMFAQNLAAPTAQMRALRVVKVETPFSLAAPQAAAPGSTTSATPTAKPSAPAPSLSKNYGVISNITANARAIYLKGQQLGNRANVFSKVGDSITASPFFLRAFGLGTYNLRRYTALQAVIKHFSAVKARDDNDSFATPSLAANNGWTTATVLDKNAAWRAVCQSWETPLMCEYRVVKPSVALIMLGTNDIALVPVDAYKTNLHEIVQYLIDNGVIPVVSTIPIREGSEDLVPVYNQIIVETALEFQIPLWDYYSAIRRLSNNGLYEGIHPSAPPGNGPEDFAAAADFTPANLRYGYTVRNLTALQVLDAVWRKAMY
jgi:uncharacterized protein YgiM (DUF1202 family)